MKSPSLFLKVLVITGFVSSIVALVAYRTGRLDGLLYGQAYSAVTVSMDGTQAFPVDTPPPGDPEFMYSSKSGFVVRQFPPDSAKKDSSIYMNDVIGSSKSFIVNDGRKPVQPKTADTVSKAVKVDSFFIDPIYSSKSGRVIEPRKEPKPKKTK